MKETRSNFERGIALTGFMGVGKSTVARHLSGILRCQRIDLDNYIEEAEKRKVWEILESDGEAEFRKIESRRLRELLDKTTPMILSLGGGTWTVAENRDLINGRGLTTVWLESTFEHCWFNMKFSRKFRPLAKDKEKAQRLFEERSRLYCLAGWHFIMRPDMTSAQIAQQIADEICC